MCIRDRPWALLRDHLIERIPLPPHQIDAMLAAGEFVGPDGMPLAPDAPFVPRSVAVSYTHLRAHETVLDLVCRLLLEKKTAMYSRVVILLPSIPGGS